MRLLRKIILDYRIQMLIYTGLAVFFAASIYSFAPDDVSINSFSDNDTHNLMGSAGSIVSDLLLQTFGISAFAFILLPILWVKILWQNKEMKHIILKLLLSIFAISMMSTSFAHADFHIIYIDSHSMIGNAMMPLSDFIIGPISPLATFMLGLFAFVIASGHNLKAFLEGIYNLISRIRIPHISLSLPKFKLWRKKEITTTPPIEFAKPRLNIATAKTESEVHEPTLAKTEVKTGKYRAPTGNFELPSHELLDVHSSGQVKLESQAELEAKSEALLRVLGEFGIKGNMTGIHQGPVVTLYEFEPSAGTKSSRVIGLADDIARSLSAVSTRIAVIPGRNALGIEIPNEQRQFFSLRELIENKTYYNGDFALPIILGKDLSGAPSVVDLSKMPHLLVAGTTGSGKSVAINAMIISLLYKHTAATCKFIMIDPKMLELSVYQDIPHLITPVVTEPGKAVVALKWAVKEMENRYRLMSNVNVRNISGYNKKIEEAIKSGEVLERTVQTGFDTETGKPTYESTPIEMEPLPFLVIIVDEMADLMLVAGKDIETSIQRLAQMARAAGIHLIMATQRPSVDVITGVIKANFPSRVSFKVTSKIDSRTILGEQGAEQLLGMGDMLYVSSTSTVGRCHGPFVDDKEVERIAKFLKAQGQPDYISNVTESEEEASEMSEIEEGDDDDSLYRQAVGIIKRDRKVSTSYIQRCLRIGYNRAAILIERMEAEGVISPLNHSGKREILLED